MLSSYLPKGAETTLADRQFPQGALTRRCSTGHNSRKTVVGGIVLVATLACLLRPAFIPEMKRRLGEVPGINRAPNISRMSPSSMAR